MATVRSLLAVHVSGDRGSLQALAVALAAQLAPVPERPTDPVALWDLIETTDAAAAGTWQEVRAARDYGRLTPAEYDYLSAAVDTLQQEAS